MPPWLQLALFVVASTLVAPAFVLANSAGNWRLALRVWRFCAVVLGAMAAPAALVWLVVLAFR